MGRASWILLALVVIFGMNSSSSLNMEALHDDADDNLHHLLHHYDKDRLDRLRRAPSDAPDSAKEAEQIVPANYSIHIPPPNGGNATEVVFSVIIMNVRDIREVNEEISLELNLRILWKDSRLKPLTSIENSKYIVLNPDLLTKIWKPDIFIDHVKTVNQPSLISKPASLRFYSDSTIRYSGRWTVTTACQMDFHYYPADTQKCHVDMKSYAYRTNILDLRWDEKRGAFLADNLLLPNFDVALDQTSSFTTQTSSGHYGTIRFTVLLRRKLSYHLYQTYIPSALFIIVSWLSFLIPPESVPGRMACCMTTLLTLTAMFGSVRQNTPNVSYVKALDIWMVACIFFVFLTLVEYTVVLKLKSLKPPKKKKKKSTTATPENALSMNTFTVLSPPASTPNGHSNESTHNSPVSGNCAADPDHPKIHMRRSSTRETAFMTGLNNLLHQDAGSGEPSSSLNLLTLPGLPKGAAMVRSASLESVKQSNNFELYAKKLEKLTSTAVPILFIAFNLIYWPWLITMAGVWAIQ